MELSNYISKVFLWMCIGLAVTFVTGATVAASATALETVFSSGMFMFLIIAELVICIYFSVRIRKMSKTSAIVCYLLYSFVTGLTFSSIFVVYEITSIMYVFLITSVVMFIMSIIGMTLKVDLTKFGSILLMMLIGVIIASIINIFLQNQGFDLVLVIISLIIFIAYIAYDIQKIKSLYEYDDSENLAILGAFELYLDFINIFIKLLRLFGKSRD